jgi:phage protein D
LQGEVRAPRLQITLEGSELPGAISADVHANNHFGADRFRVRFAASALSPVAFHIPGQRLEVSVALGGFGVSVITGLVDRVGLDPTTEVIDIEGRDLSSLMIEAQLDETFANRTSSEIAETFAGRHGLQALIERTSTPVGRYYQSEHDRVGLGQFAKALTEWDLLAFLAAREGFDLFMEGDALRFGPPAAQGASELRTEDCVSLQLDHCVGMAREIEVTVRSWGTKSGTAVTTAVQASGAGTVWKHGITRPNLTSEDAQKLAERVLADLKRHEWAATATMPGDLTLTPRSRVLITGTGTPWDREYGISQLSRHLDVRRGFTQRLSLQGVQ